jgi:hypothetical protein
MSKLSELEAKREKIRLLEKKLELQEGLPFLHGWNWYPWAREFFESTNKTNLLCAANQISKSSTQIRKCIDWATNEAKWKALWPRRPKMFWYMYPSSKQAAAEFMTKWQQFLPQGKFKTDPVYGWKESWIKKDEELNYIRFNSGVYVFFKNYTQNITNLQSGTLDALFCDEELPEELYDELVFRLSSSDGYFHMVFTATLGQDFWRLAMEPGPKEEEKLPSASKWVVSMYDCLLYEDGSPSHWTPEKIQAVVAKCRTHKEVLKRVYGRFVKDDQGMKYETFDSKRHVVKTDVPIPRNWFLYCGADWGGGVRSHLSAICFVAASPDFKKGRVFLGWRGDGIETTAGDVVDKLISLKKEHNLTGRMTAQYYDWACRDMQTIASRMNESLLPAEKKHDIGEQVLNTLFKHNMLLLDDSPELQKLAAELSTLRKDIPKNKAKDDLADALRYAVTKIPWNWSAILESAPGAEVPAVEARAKTDEDLIREQIEERRKEFTGDGQASEGIDQEFAEINELYGA